MRFLDLHCDTVTECRKRRLSVKCNPLHLDFDRGAAFSEWVQTFAVWIPDELRGDAAWSYYLDNAAFFECECSESGATVCRTYDEIRNALADGKCAAVFAVEGGAVLGGRINRLYELYRIGVRILTLTWNAENELGFGCQSAGGRLKPFGTDVVRAMDELGMIADVSHLDRVGFYDVLDTSRRPVLASHSTSAAVLERTRKDGTDKVFSVRRALDDGQIRALSERGGLIGLNFCRSFLGDSPDDGFDAALRHASHILEIGGESVLAVGSDFDGCEIHPELAGIEYIPRLYAYFTEHGFSRVLCEKIFFENGLHFFKNVL
ncbi:MAG: membrane dipeptidase [Clostridia bacterium]|nr:membrane dipeptidase [Clostridia bacterium]